MNDPTMKILYIAGWDRSGSTILDQILGQLPGFFSVGELVDLWDRGPETLCGCGRLLKDCDLWREVCLEAFGSTPESFDFRAYERKRQNCARSRHLILLPSPRLRRSLNPELESYVQTLTRLYRALERVTGARVLVDSSKQPAHAYLLQMSRVAEVYIVHLIRDPRGCAYSYQRRKAHPALKGGHFPTMHPMKNSLHWIVANLATQMISRISRSHYLRVRYEDFVRAPRGTVYRLTEFIGEAVPQVPFASEHTVILRPLHGVSGNSVRFQTGAVRLRLDEQWKSEMKTRHKALVTALTSFLLPHYGYGFGLNGAARAEDQTLEGSRSEG
jgi:hypothetical protein